MIGTPRRTCRGRPIICPGPCNHRRQNRLEKKSAEKQHWHACSWFNVDEEDEDDEEKDEKEINAGKIPIRLDETATMTTNVTLIDVALSQIAVCLEEKGEKTRPCPVSIRCNNPGCCPVPEIQTVAACPEQDEEQSPKSLTNISAESPVMKCPTKNKSHRWRNKTLSKYSVYILVFFLYALVHMFLAVPAAKASLYEAFVSSQICGIAALILWKMTGTIPL